MSNRPSGSGSGCHGVPLVRVPSDETLVSQYEQSVDMSDLNSLVTNTSEETMSHNTRIFNEHISSYSCVREFPIVSTFMHPGVLLFSSSKSLEAYSQKNLSAEQVEANHSQGLGIPILQTSTPVLNIFKKNSPFLIIYKFNSKHERVLFCKVYFKILANNITCYVMVFQLDDDSLKTVVLLNNGVKPSVDFTYESTKVRATGVTGTTSTFANGLIKLFIMKDTASMLCDDILIDNALEDINSPIKNFKMKMNKSSELYSSLVQQNRSTVGRIMGSAEPQVNIPFATFVDNGDEKIKGINIVKNGTIKLFDTNNDTDVNNKTLMISSILLVLREQEFTKNKGNSKPTFVHHNTN